ncbi:uncharacterized protein LOC119112971 [Pollicipes pollicipes]|uniref:uncharacterized protein LOC119112971 n=1 Tax=Pollicipes pollicipes TaxID=41117 RepID=UPI001884DBE4|nr:uncharacterized protein LOC119112971 [Pollicipes pollicipes]
MAGELGKSEALERRRPDYIRNAATGGPSGRFRDVDGAEAMSAEEADQRVRGLYRRLRGADHYRSLPALAAEPSPPAPVEPGTQVTEHWRIRRPINHFDAEMTVAAICDELRARLLAQDECLDEPLRSDLQKYVDFIGAACLDAEDEQMKRTMAEKVMRLLTQRQTADCAPSSRGTWQERSEPSVLSRARSASSSRDRRSVGDPR